MEIITHHHQYADKEYEKPTYKHKCFSYHISNKIFIIIVSLAFMWLSIWNFIYISQLKYQMQLHASKLEQLKSEANVLFKMFQNIHGQLETPININLNDLQHSIVLNNQHNKQNNDIYNNDNVNDNDNDNDNDDDLSDTLLSENISLKNYGKRKKEAKLINEKFPYMTEVQVTVEMEGKVVADKQQIYETKDIYNNRKNVINLYGKKQIEKNITEITESQNKDTFIKHTEQQIEEQLKRNKRSHKFYADITDKSEAQTKSDPEFQSDFESELLSESETESESNLKRHNLNKPIATTMKKGKWSSITVPSSVQNSNKPAAHFHISRSIPDSHSNIRMHPYLGDLYIGHPSWTNDINVAKDFHIENGFLRVYQPGLYYVYAQICYNNSYDHNGFIIFHGQKPFLQCLNTIPTNLSTKLHTCHTSGLIYLKTDEKLHLRDFHRDRNAILRDSNYRSYFGLMKI